jgi:hypothetical protein
VEARSDFGKNATEFLMVGDLGISEELVDNKSISIIGDDSDGSIVATGFYGEGFH